ncbi:hypothetical protein [Haloplanus halophilus]|uniref:hypothetical protein n=1 Tax=Haloplanus halophilus TaxID=2949993 RepID=UPI00203AC3D3|nr:hypothetical protein [Haloplanus sp. GDY1]
MKRRDYLVGLTGIAAGTSFTLGTGAFTSTTAHRSLEVSTAADSEAMLRLTQRGAGRRSTVNGGDPQQVEFEFPGRDASDDLGLGVDSVYEFDIDAGEAGRSSPIAGLLRIENRGNEPVEVYSTHETASDLEIELYDVTDDDETALRDDPAVLDIGEFVDVGFRIRTHGAGIGTFDETLTIVADPVSD